jgi:transcriptional regulator with XRE-family HTH domain
METPRVRSRCSPPPGLGSTLNAARVRTGYGLREAARVLGISPGYLAHLEAGRRCPSRTVALVLVDGLRLDDDERSQVLAAAVDGGRDYRPRGLPKGYTEPMKTAS